jgi:arylformamidase
MSNSPVDRRGALEPGTDVAAGVAVADKPQSPTDIPKVWLDLDQAALDAAYDQTVFAPNFAQIIKRMAKNSASMRQRAGEPQVFSYGASPIERLFYYPAKIANAPLHIHVHGGAWRQRKAEDVAFPAEMFNDAGIGFAVYDFTSVEETSGDLNPMLGQVCAGLAWLARNAHKLGGNPERLYLSGFSSGAHLAAVAMTTNWSPFGFTRNPFKGALLASGMYDLHPVRLSSRSQYVMFTDEVEETMSPQRHVATFDVPVILVHGTYDTPEFQRQTRDFAATLKGAGKPVQYIVVEDYNHFEVMEMFGNPYSPLGRAAIAQISQHF